MTATATTSTTAPAALWSQPIEVLGLTGEFESGKTLFGLTVAPGSATLAYDMEKSNATYTSLGFTRVDVPTEMLKAHPAGYKPIETFEWWLAHVRAIPPGRFRVIMLDPVSEIETGLAEWVRTHPTHFGKTAAQYAKAAGLMWGDVKEYWKSILADLSSRCETFVFTSHMTSVWERDGPTGKRKAKGKETLMELATLYLQMERKKDKTGAKPDKPAAVVLKSRLSSIRFDATSGDTIIIPTLPPRLPVATPFSIRQYMAAPPDYSKLAAAELAPEEEMTAEQREELRYQIAKAEQTTEELRMNREQKQAEKDEALAKRVAANHVGVRPGFQPGAQAALPVTKASKNGHAATAAAATDTTAPIGSTATTDSGPTDEQLSKLSDLRARMFATEGIESDDDRKAFWSGILKRRNVTSALDLTHAQADELIGKLAERVNEKEPMDALFAGAVAMTGPVATSGAPTAPTT